MKCQLQFQEALRVKPLLLIHSINIMDSKCSNKHTGNTLYERRKYFEEAEPFWTASLQALTNRSPGYCNTCIVLRLKKCTSTVYTIYIQPIYISPHF